MGWTRKVQASVTLSSMSLIGHRFADPIVQADCMLFGLDDKPMIHARFSDGEKMAP
jgi:hypothetical protein